MDSALRLFSSPKQVPCQLYWYIVCMRADYGMNFEGVSRIYLRELIRGALLELIGPATKNDRPISCRPKKNLLGSRLEGMSCLV